MYRVNMLVIACASAASLASSAASGVQVWIDEFGASGTNADGAFGFVDGFGDGTPPPCGPNGCAAQPTFYGVLSTSPLPAESGGALQLDSSNGVASANATGGSRVVETVTVSGVKSELLSTGGDISAYAVYGLPSLSGPLNNGYGLRFIDAPFGSGPGSNHEVLELNVQYWTGNASHAPGVYVRYQVQDFVLDTITTVDADMIDIPLAADQIYLSLSRAAGSDAFAAQYAYVTGGGAGPLTSLGSAQGFRYEDYVRPQVQAFETPASIPEPDSWWLATLGVAMLAVARRLPPSGQAR